MENAALLRKFKSRRRADEKQNDVGKGKKKKKKKK